MHCYRPEPAPTARCPSCSSSDSRHIGESTFAVWSEVLEVAALREKSGALYRCRVCSLVYRFPVPSETDLDAAYRAIPLESWSYSEPLRWHRLRDLLTELVPNKRVLDVGCFRGDFLHFLGDSYRKFGIEPSLSARALAEQRGVTILGSTAMEKIDGFDGYFGSIVMMDVAEHLHNPDAAFEHLSRYLAPGGVLAVLTGNADHFLPRFSLPYYWYMSFPIHLVYLGSRYFRWLSRVRGWQVVGSFQYAHQQGTFYETIREYETGLRMMVWGRFLRGRKLESMAKRLPLLRGIAAMRSPQCLFGIADHHGVVLRKVG